MFKMFSNAENFNGDISNWDVSNVIDMEYMFSDAYNFNQDLSNWEVGNVLNCSWFSTNANSWALPKPKFTKETTNWRAKAIEDITPYNNEDFLNESDSYVEYGEDNDYYRFTEIEVYLKDYDLYIWFDNLTVPKDFDLYEIAKNYAE